MGDATRIDALVNAYRKVATRLDEAQKEVAELAARRQTIVAELAEMGLSYSVIAKLTDLSVQRVGQLAQDARRRQEAPTVRLEAAAIARGEQCMRCGGAVDGTVCTRCGFRNLVE